MLFFLKDKHREEKKDSKIKGDLNIEVINKEILIRNTIKDLQSELKKLEIEINENIKRLNYFPTKSDHYYRIEEKLNIDKEKYGKVYEDLEGWKKKLGSNIIFIPVIENKKN